LREVIYPVLELREEKRTFVKVEGVKVDFFLLSLLYGAELGFVMSARDSLPLATDILRDRTQLRLRFCSHNPPHLSARGMGYGGKILSANYIFNVIMKTFFQI
jgi:hypothetical protein